jgi:hypothetical protein
MSASHEQGPLESWGQAVQDVEGHRLLDLEERRKREIEEQIAGYLRVQRENRWWNRRWVARRIPQRIAALEVLRAEIVARRRGLAGQANRRLKVYEENYNDSR